jgi:hypothetical protein
MPKTKTQNKTEVNKNGKELDDIVDYIIKKCNEVIEEYKSQKGRKIYKEKNINSWNLIIDNIPVSFNLECKVSSKWNENDTYILSLLRRIYWNDKICLEENLDNFYSNTIEIKVEKDIIDKNDITRTTIKMFNFDNLKFCKIKNRFVEKDTIFLKAINYFDLKCQDVDECCVCYDKTTTKTRKCNHYLCLECVPKIRTFVPPNSLNYIDCPMCKQKVNEIISETDNNTASVSDYDEN